MYACLKEQPLKDQPDALDCDRFLPMFNAHDQSSLDAILTSLKGDGLPLQGGAECDAVAAERAIVSGLASNGLLEFKSARSAPALVLAPTSTDFDPVDDVDLRAQVWKISRFCYLHQHNGEIVLRNPKALCFLTIKDAAVMQLLFQFNAPVTRASLEFAASITDQSDSVFAMLAKAQVILPCDAKHLSIEDTDTTQRQWDFHDLLFHSSSRIGRSEKPIGGTFRFKGILPPQPAVKPNPWAGEVISLFVPNLQNLFHHDMPLTAALESRRSTRSHSLLPLTLEQLGEFL